jgi:hypothetical protein
MFLLLLLIAVSLAFAGAYRSGRIVSSGTRAEGRRLVRSARVAAGHYDLKIVMAIMIDDMFASVMPSITKSYMPNVVTFGLHPDDVHRWGDCFGQLADELSAVIAAHVDRRKDLQLGGPLQVTLVQDADARRGHPTFRVRFAAAAASTPAGAGAVTGADTDETVIQPLTKTVAVSDGGGNDDNSDCWALLVHSGELPHLVELRGELVVGRDRTAGLRLGEQSVSRCHARLALLDDEVSIVDLSSRNGTFVNGDRVSMAMLATGDRIRFGTKLEAELVWLDNQC